MAGLIRLRPLRSNATLRDVTQSTWHRALEITAPKHGHGERPARKHRAEKMGE